MQLLVTGKPGNKLLAQRAQILLTPRQQPQPWHQNRIEITQQGNGRRHPPSNAACPSPPARTRNASSGRRIQGLGANCRRKLNFFREQIRLQPGCRGVARIPKRPPYQFIDFGSKPAQKRWESATLHVAFTLCRCQASLGDRLDRAPACKRIST